MLEFGCGAAPLPGVAAGLLGAQKTVVSDMLPELVAYAAANVERNNPANVERNNQAANVERNNQGGIESSVSAHVWEWGSAAQGFDPAEFDTYLAADCQYGPEAALEHLAAAISLRGSSGAAKRLLLARTVRQPERERSWVTDCLIARHGWVLARVVLDDRPARWRREGRVAHDAVEQADLELLLLTRKY